MIQKQKSPAASAPAELTGRGNARAREVAEKTRIVLAAAGTKLRPGLQVLSDLADYLDELPNDDRFQMCLWGQQQDCGFRGCAIGWGIHSGIVEDHPAFREAGGVIMPVLPTMLRDWWVNVGKPFGVSDVQARRMFAAANEKERPDNSTQAVAKTIRRVVAECVEAEKKKP